uniref:Calcium-dependent protein kinase CPK4 n=1 Tax=Solanum tuberosum TaxID=4113 RepID=M0ZVQ6_SOLTU
MNEIRDIWPCVASAPPAPAEFARKAFGMKLLSPKQPAAINVHNLVVLNVHSL